MKKIAAVGLFIILIVVSICFYYYFKRVGEVGKPEFSVKAEKLFKEFDTNEPAAEKKYLGKVIEVSGKVRDESASDSAYNVNIESGDIMGGISCEVDVTKYPDVKNLKRGDAVRIKGVCSGKLMDVVLVNCTLEKK